MMMPKPQIQRRQRGPEADLETSLMLKMVIQMDCGSYRVLEPCSQIDTVALVLQPEEASVRMVR